MSSKFEEPVLWEFSCRLQGYGRNCKEALLDACARKIEDVNDPRNATLVSAIERNEVLRIYPSEKKDARVDGIAKATEIEPT